MPIDKGRTLEASWSLATVVDFAVEMRTSHHGFCLRLTNISRGNSAVWGIVDRLTKSAHFILMKTGKKMHMLPLAEAFVNEIVSRHGQPVSITSDRDNRFVSRF